MGNKNCPSFWRNAVKARLSLRSAIWYSDMEAAPFGKINWVNPILPDRTDRSRSLFNLQLSAGHHPGLGCVKYIDQPEFPLTGITPNFGDAMIPVKFWGPV